MEEILKTFLPQLGFGAVLLWFMYATIKNTREDNAQLRQRNNDLQDKFIALTQSTTATVMQVQMTMTAVTSSMETQRQSTETQRFELQKMASAIEVLARKGP